MRTRTIRFWMSGGVAAAVATLALLPPQAAACDGCSIGMALKLLRGDQPSQHAAEMERMISAAEGPRSALLRQALSIPAAPAGTGPDGRIAAVSPVAQPGTAALRPAPVGPGVAVAPANARPAGAATQPFELLAQSTFTAPAAAPPAAPPAPVAAPLTEKTHPFGDIIRRDRKLDIPETSYVIPGTPPDKRFTIVMREGDVSLGNGVIYSGFTVNDTIPGPTLVMDEGDVVELTVDNQGEVPHGVSLHAVYTQTSKYLGKIEPKEKKSLSFRVNQPGVYMYHCAPGGHAIPMHTLLGQYGMMVVKPKKQKFRMEEEIGRKPDLEIFLIQHELYASGKDAIEGRPAYVMFNGTLFRYVDAPIKVKPGDFVRIYLLNAGPNLQSTFHIVGIIWDFAYWQGMPNPENTLVGGQTVLAGPSDSWVVDFRVPPDEGKYLMVTHAFGSTTRGAIGILDAAANNERSPTVMAQGPSRTKEEFEQLKAKAVRTISPFKPGSEDLANPYRLSNPRDKLRISIIGNSFYPKVAEVPAGTTVEWTNEDVFTFFDGEFSGIHDVDLIDGPGNFWSPMLGHGEKFSVKLTNKGDYRYICTPHPYMEGIIRVK